MTCDQITTQAIERAARIAEQNDRFRALLNGSCDTTIKGSILITQGVRAMGLAFEARARAAVADFMDFSEDNNPQGERDFGVFEIEGQRLFWKIDLYDRDLQWATPEPDNPDVTRRVLTIMLASEY